jgi:WD40 repeat protein
MKAVSLSGEITCQLHGKSLFSLPGHQDWVRAVTVNPQDTKMLSGGLGSMLGIWNLPAARSIAMVPLPVQEALEIEAIMDLAFQIGSETCFYALQRCGFVVCGDLRCPDIFQFRKRVHYGRGSFLETSESPNRLLTSARGDGAKLWDLRRFADCPEASNYLQKYNQHTSQHVPLGHDFLRFEKFFVTGSDDGHAYIYDTLTGELVKQLKLSSERAQHCLAESVDSISFFASFYNARILGYVSTEGPLITHLPNSTKEIKDEYSKLAWDAAISQFSDQVLKMVRSNPGRLPTTYDQWLDMVRTNQDEASQRLAEKIREAYNEVLKSSTPRLVRDMNQFHQEREKAKLPLKKGRKQRKCSSFAPTVKRELHLVRK